VSKRAYQNVRTYFESYRVRLRSDCYFVTRTRRFPGRKSQVRANVYACFTFARFHVTSASFYKFPGASVPKSFGFWSTTTSCPVPSAFVAFCRTGAPFSPFRPSSVDYYCTNKTKNKNVDHARGFCLFTVGRVTLTDFRVRS